MPLGGIGLHLGFHEFPERLRLEPGDFLPDCLGDRPGDEFGYVFFEVSDVAQLAGLSCFEGEEDVLENETHEPVFGGSNGCRIQIGIAEEDAIQLGVGNLGGPDLAVAVGNFDVVLDPSGPGIVSESHPGKDQAGDDWEKVQELLRSQTESKIPSRAAHALSGLVDCVCGSPMQIPSELEKFACTSCSIKIAIADLEQIFLKDLHAFAGKHAEALAGLLATQLPTDDLSREARNLELEMEALEKQVTAAQQSVLDGKMKPDDFSSLLKPLDTKRRTLQSQLKKVQAQAKRKKLIRESNGDPPHFSADELIEFIWPKFPLATQQKLARVLIDRYVVSTGRVEIHSRVTSSLLTAAVGQHMEPNDPIPADDPEPVPGEPVYIRLPRQGTLCPHSGFTRSKLNNLILSTSMNNHKPLVKSLNSCLPGKKRGNRLIIWASLKAYLHQLER